ncbi:MAG: hypothetical protein GY787_15650 [Alteromonadales bacterium]|nr:hypothetical protein [Alteromonadales bacterium]
MENNNNQRVNLSINGYFSLHKKSTTQDVFSYQFPITYKIANTEKQIGQVTLYSDSSVILDRVQFGFIFLLSMR